MCTGDLQSAITVSPHSISGTHNQFCKGSSSRRCTLT